MDSPISLSAGRTRAALPLLIVLAGAPLLRAELKWAFTDRQETAAAGADRIVVDYPFTNTGPDAVVLQALRADCECVSASSDRAVYAPGTGGVVRLTFVPEENTGRQRKTVFVTTSLDPEHAIALRLDVVIPAVVTIEPGVLSWDEANPSAPRWFTIAIDPAAGASIRAVETDSPSVHLALRPTPAAYLYRLEPSIAPDAKDGGIRIVVKADVAGRTIQRSATLVVRRP